MNRIYFEGKMIPQGGIRTVYKKELVVELSIDTEHTADRFSHNLTNSVRFMRSAVGEDVERSVGNT
jgi:hypothetical protein